MVESRLWSEISGFTSWLHPLLPIDLQLVAHLFEALMSSIVERDWVFHSMGLRIKLCNVGKSILHRVCLVFSAQYILAIITTGDIFPRFTLKGVQKIGCVFVCLNESCPSPDCVCVGGRYVFTFSTTQESPLRFSKSPSITNGRVNMSFRVTRTSVKSLLYYFSSRVTFNKHPTWIYSSIQVKWIW